MDKLLILSAVVREDLIRTEESLSGKIDVLGERLSYVRRSLESIILDYLQSKFTSNKYYRYLDYDDVLTDGENQLVKIYILEKFFNTELFGTFETAYDDFLNDFHVFVNSAIVTYDCNLDNDGGDYKIYTKGNHDLSAVHSSAIAIANISNKLKTVCIIETNDKDHNVIKYVPDVRLVTEEHYSFKGTIIGVVDEITSSKSRVIIICKDGSTREQMFYTHESRSQLSNLWDTQEVATFYVNGDAPKPNPTSRDCTTLHISSIDLLQEKLI